MLEIPETAREGDVIFVLRIREGYLLRSIVDEWVVVGIGSTARPNRFMMLNDSAARLWELLQKGAEEEELTEALIGEYGVDCETARADADAFIRRLLESGIAEAY